MEYIEFGVPITCSNLFSANRDRWMRELQHLVESFYVEGLVHGDLWDANIICKGDSVTVIEFDWGGKDGQVSLQFASMMS